MTLAFIFGINEDVIQVNNNKDIKFFGQNLIDVALEAGRSVEKTKTHHLIFEVAVSNSEGDLPLIAFSYPHLVVSTGQVQLSELLSPTQSIQGLPNER